MAEQKTPPKTPPRPTEEVFWGIVYLREDLQDVKRDLRDLRQEVNERLRKVDERFDKIDERFEKIELQISELRKEILEIHKALHNHTRWTIGLMILLFSIFTAIIKL
ncbi:MAG: hypothetical protein D6681_17645, partial [Calditrichaeota bacterium]